MAHLYYVILFGVSLLLTAVYVLAWRKHYDANITSIFILVPIANLGYILQTTATNVEVATIAVKVVYLGGCFLSFFITMAILGLCEIRISRWVRLFFFLTSLTLYGFILTIGNRPYFYKSIDLKIVDGQSEIIKEYGPIHPVFYVYMTAIFIVGFTAICYSFVKKKQVPKSILYLLVLPELASGLCLAGYKLLGTGIELTPGGYVFAQFMYILIVNRISYYKVNDVVVDSMVQNGDTGFVTVDKNLHFLGANETAKSIIPALEGLSIDQDIRGIKDLEKNIVHWIEHFEKDQIADNLYIRKSDDGDDRIYAVQTAYIYDRSKKYGYRLYFSDDTENQKYIALLDKYNIELQEEVEKKTKHIVDMHNNLIMGMATMVESRDNSTGGHIKRTSECVRILLDEMRKDSELDISYKYIKNLIKAAPMHDLGKVAVDDAILRKPGRFMPEEFDKMKMHAAEGARIVHEILKETDDEDFKVLAENVAHYHHERMDGSGYPEGLKGEEIPLEARIMAIADVYDALVSKRVYKDSMSFEKADEIMMESMGKHFDEKLKPYYVSARPRLEAYYSSLE